MDVKEIKELIELINSSDLAYFEVTSNELTIKMDKSLTRNVSENVTIESNSKVQEVTNNVIDNKVEVNNQEVKITDEANIEVIKSPMIGTFYASSAPGKPDFVGVGDNISKGTVLCIVEAMKLMNEIESEFDGEIVEVIAKDGAMVEYGQPIFKIRRA